MATEIYPTQLGGGITQPRKHKTLGWASVELNFRALIDIVIQTVSHNEVAKNQGILACGSVAVIDRAGAIVSIVVHSDTLEPIALALSLSTPRSTYKEMRFNLCTWFGEISSCSCLTALPGPALVVLNKICKE